MRTIWLLGAIVVLSLPSTGASSGGATGGPTRDRDAGSDRPTEATKATGATKASEATKETEVELWAGHQATVGARRVPILGTLVTRSDTYLLATIRRDGEEVHLEQRLCRIEIAPFAGVKVSMLAEGVPKMPPTDVTFRRRGPNWEAVPWSTSWNFEDVDGDGKPGATVHVEAPICGGTVYVGSNSQAIARGADSAGGIAGELKVSIDQRILETSGGCLGLVAKDTREQVAGNFAYVPVPAGSTCGSLMAAEKWPAHAKAPPDPRGAPTDRREIDRRDIKVR